MPAPRSALIAFAAFLAASSSLVMLQSARPALADQDDHRYTHQQRYDRDDHHRHANTNVNHGGWNDAGHWNNGRRWATTNNGSWTRNTNGYWTRSNGYWTTGNTYWTTNNGNWNANHYRRADRDDRHRHDRDDHHRRHRDHHHRGDGDHDRDDR